MEFVPVVYEHAAQFLARSPREVSRDADLLFEAHAAAYRLYGHRPIVVGIDVYNAEAEAYGAPVDDPGGNEVPTITERICATSREIESLAQPDIPRAGRFSMILRAARRLRAEFPDAEVMIPLSGPFSIAGSLAGFENLLMEMLRDPEPAARALLRLAHDQVAVAAFFATEGFSPLFFESSASPPLLSPSLFDAVLEPALEMLIRETSRMTGEPPALILGGDTARILPSLLKTGTGYVICPPETDGTKFMAIVASRPDVAVRINVKPGLFTGGSIEVIRSAIDAAVTLAGGRPNVCVGSGVLPYNALPSLVVEAKQYLEDRH